jgi:hypothetical protein
MIYADQQRLAKTDDLGDQSGWKWGCNKQDCLEIG